MVHNNKVCKWAKNRRYFACVLWFDMLSGLIFPLLMLDTLGRRKTLAILFCFITMCCCVLLKCMDRYCSILIILFYWGFFYHAVSAVRKWVSYESSGGPFSSEISIPSEISLEKVKFHSKFPLKYGSPGKPTSCEISSEISSEISHENGPLELS